MEGSFSTIPLSDVLEMIHASRGTGFLRLESGKLPLHLHFEEGEVVAGGILDWEASRPSRPFRYTPSRGTLSLKPARYRVFR